MSADFEYPRITFGNRLARTVWAVVHGILFRPTPNAFFFWRRAILRLFGARIAQSARVYPNVTIWAPWNLTIGARSAIANNVEIYNVSEVIVGEDVVISQRSFLCTATKEYKTGRRHLAASKIRIANNCWIAAGVFLGPGVFVGENSRVLACAVVTKSLPANTVWAGNPAVQIKSID
jgi:putative colanic acid biosynthesis acetyltransferase WcaF